MHMCVVVTLCSSKHIWGSILEHATNTTFHNLPVILTCENGWHHGSEHEKKHSEENAARIVYYFGSFIANPKVNHSYEQPNDNMREKPHLC